MANIKSQIKRNKTNEKARQRNASAKSAIRTSIKKVKLAVEAKDLAKNKLPIANNMKVKRFVIKKEIENGSNQFVLINAKKVSPKTRKLSEDAIKNILPKVRQLFSKVLVLPTFKIDDEDHWINDLGGDSMNYVELVQEIDHEFGIEISEEKYGVLTCVNDFVEEIAHLKK